MSASPPFSIGSPSRRITRSTTRNNQLTSGASSQTTQLRRSTRQAALDANIRIVEQQDRRKKRRTAAGKEPIVLNDDNQKMAAVDLTSNDKSAPDLLSDFTCPICLDCPARLTDLATISGCTHKFCWDCIDTWANTENKCPCCKARFRTIDRVEHVVTNAAAGNSRARKRRSNGATAVVNSRTVQDRNQPSGLTMNARLIEQILQQFSEVSAQHGGSNLTGQFATNGPMFRFTNVDNRPVMVIDRQVVEGGDNNAAVGRMELYLADTEGEGGRPGRGRARYLLGGGSVGGAAAVGAASAASQNNETNTPLFTFGRRPTSARAGAATGSESGRPPAPRRASSPHASRRTSPFRFGAAAAGASGPAASPPGVSLFPLSTRATNRGVGVASDGPGRYTMTITLNSISGAPGASSSATAANTNANSTTPVLRRSPRTSASTPRNYGTGSNASRRRAR